VNHFNIEPVSYTEVYKTLEAMDTKKSAGSDNLDPYRLKIVAGIITEPVAHMFNLSLLTNSIRAFGKQIMSPTAKEWRSLRCQ
jgi:hypothetical protein